VLEIAGNDWKPQIFVEKKKPVIPLGITGFL